MRVRDLTGQRFGKLFVERHAGSTGRRALWLCLCDCGKEKVLIGKDLISGNTKSCGCLQNAPIHGMARSKIYKVWRTMKARCLNPRNPAYKNYGGRGITIYEPWITSFSVYFDYVSQLP